MRRRYLLGLAACLTLSFPGLVTAKAPERAERPLARDVQTPKVPQSRIDELAKRFNPNGTSSAVLMDVRTGKVLEYYNPGKAMPPASVTKLLTTLYGMEKLGTSYRFTTRIVATGPIIEGIVQGDLVLVGGGDPALDSDELVKLIEDLTERGVKGVAGDFLYDDTALPFEREIDNGQPIEAAYNPSISGLNLNFNRVHLKWGPEEGINVTARAERHAPDVASVRMETVNRSGPIYQFEEKGGADYWSLAAPAFKRPGAVWLPVRIPAAYAAEVFRTLAQENNIRLPYPKKSEDYKKHAELARFERRELKLLCRSMMHFSTNLTAEAIGMAASGQNSMSSSGIAMQIWAKDRFGVTSPYFRDHSGLGDNNRISAIDMATIVTRAAREDTLEGVLRRYYVQGPSGKKPAAAGVDVRAKTGTLNFVRGLSGIITGARGQELAFAIFSADLKERAEIDGTNARQPGARRYGRRAHAFEQAVLRDWILAHAR